MAIKSQNVALISICVIPLMCEIQSFSPLRALELAILDDQCSLLANPVRQARSIQFGSEEETIMSQVKFDDDEVKFQLDLERAARKSLDSYERGRDSVPKAPEDAEDENSDSCEQEGYCGAKRVSRAGGRRSRAKAANRKQRKPIQPTKEFDKDDDLNNRHFVDESHPFDIASTKNIPPERLARWRPPPHRDLTPQNVWNQAFDIWYAAAEVYKGLLREAGFGDFLKIRPIMINLPGYMCALA
ncbi:unnamed protein product [Dovyalis caffra]|uniref:Uncharacterized protein n=1 Tax=Dovyalis caffra TaxID=77055 RepID=A0AAV1QT24_9ROSI|nr:unnamed protein product [Dovyalis caffra]